MPHLHITPAKLVLAAIIGASVSITLSTGVSAGLGVNASLLPVTLSSSTLLYYPIWMGVMGGIAVAVALIVLTSWRHER